MSSAVYAKPRPTSVMLHRTASSSRQRGPASGVCRMSDSFRLHNLARCTQCYRSHEADVTWCIRVGVIPRQAICNLLDHWRVGACEPGDCVPCLLCDLPCFPHCFKPRSLSRRSGCLFPRGPIGLPLGRDHPQRQASHCHWSDSLLPAREGGWRARVTR
eukprot:3684843-Prymnesium_polylepis.1